MTHEETTIGLEGEDLATPPRSAALAEASENALPVPSSPSSPSEPVQGQQTPKPQSPAESWAMAGGPTFSASQMDESYRQARAAPAPSPRDLAAVIDAMLAEIPRTPETNDLFYSLNYWRNALKIGTSTSATPHQICVDIAKNLVAYASAEPWYERVMAIWSGESASPLPPPRRSLSSPKDVEGWRAGMGSEFDATILQVDAEVTRAILETPDPPFSPAIAGEAWAFEEHDVADLAKERIDAPMPPETWCADCGGQPQLILLAQDCAKCVRCFILSGMNARCFMCKKNPTEAIVRAIHPTDGKDDTVGCCIDCLLKHVSAGRN